MAAVDAIASTTSSTTVTPSTAYSVTDPNETRKQDEARAAAKAEQTRLDEMKADQTRAEQAREQRARADEVSRNSNGEVIGTTISTTA